jgi:hypothetical protein
MHTHALATALRAAGEHTGAAAWRGKHTGAYAHLELFERVEPLVIQAAVLAHDVASASTTSTTAAALLQVAACGSNPSTAASRHLLPVAAHVAQPLDQRHVVCARRRQLLRRGSRLGARRRERDLQVVHLGAQPLALAHEHAQQRVRPALAACCRARSSASRVAPVWQRAAAAAARAQPAKLAAAAGRERRCCRAAAAAGAAAVPSVTPAAGAATPTRALPHGAQVVLQLCHEVALLLQLLLQLGRLLLCCVQLLRCICQRQARHSDLVLKFAVLREQQPLQVDTNAGSARCRCR